MGSRLLADCLAVCVIRTLNESLAVNSSIPLRFSRTTRLVLELALCFAVRKKSFEYDRKFQGGTQDRGTGEPARSGGRLLHAWRGAQVPGRGSRNKTCNAQPFASTHGGRLVLIMAGQCAALLHI